MSYYTRIAPFDLNEQLQGKIIDRNASEMTLEQQEFLCGLINEYKPKKIVEIGVAEGGTTSIILCCLDELGLNSSLFSVDLSEKLWRDETKATGYAASKYLEENESSVSFRLLLGRYLPECIEEIGSDIDFVILDTVHHLPGEILDYLVLLPYLSKEAIVVLHDVVLEHNNSKDDRSSFVNQLLFSVVNAKKFINITDKYPNIAAFLVEKETKESVADVCSALTIPWSYMPKERALIVYDEFVKKHYPESIYCIFEHAVKLNKSTHKKRDMYLNNYLSSLCGSLFSSYEHIVFYGAGIRAKCLLDAIDEMNVSAISSKIEFLVSTENESRNKKCLWWDDLNYSQSSTMIVLAANSDEMYAKLLNSTWHWIALPEDVWQRLEQIYS